VGWKNLVNLYWAVRPQSEGEYWEMHGRSMDVLRPDLVIAERRKTKFLLEIKMVIIVFQLRK
jgi:hypothetical protein